MTASNASNELQFRLIGARVSQFELNEEKLLQVGLGKVTFSVATSVSDPHVSEHKYSGRDVIELSSIISLSLARPEGEVDQDFFMLRCTAGFVGIDEDIDGNIDEFNKLIDFYSRGVYWLTRSRLDSVLSVTLVKSIGSLPWDMVSPEIKSKPKSIRKAGKKANS